MRCSQQEFSRFPLLPKPPKNPSVYPLVPCIQIPLAFGWHLEEARLSCREQHSSHCVSSCLLLQCLAGAQEVEIPLSLSLARPILFHLVCLPVQEEMLAGVGLTAESGAACGTCGSLAVLVCCWCNCIF